MLCRLYEASLALREHHMGAPGASSCHSIPCRAFPLWQWHYDASEGIGLRSVIQSLYNSWPCRAPGYSLVVQPQQRFTFLHCCRRPNSAGHTDLRCSSAAGQLSHPTLNQQWQQHLSFLCPLQMKRRESPLHLFRQLHLQIPMQQREPLTLIQSLRRESSESVIGEWCLPPLSSLLSPLLIGEPRGGC